VTFPEVLFGHFFSFNAIFGTSDRVEHVPQSENYLHDPSSNVLAWVILVIKTATPASSSIFAGSWNNAGYDFLCSTIVIALSG